MEYCFFVSKPTLLMHDEVAGHPTANKRARRAFSEIWFQRDASHGTLEVKRIRFGLRMNNDLP
jgi:hypothetical protein